MDDQHRIDYILLVTIIALLVIGLLMVFSATFALGYQLYQQPTYFLMRQLLWVGVGALAMMVTTRLEYHIWLRFSTWIILATLALLILVLLVGDSRFGGQRWLFNGSVQPSELAKLATIIYVAHWLSSKGEQLRRFDHGLIPYAVLVGGITGLIILQRDLGTAVLVAATALTMFFVAGASIWQFSLIGLLGSAALVVLVTQSSYRMSRVLTFLDPFSADPQGAGYQIRQILIALGSGGIFGLGFGVSRQKFGYIPASHTDGIFAILGEELGLVGSLLVIGLFALLAYRGFKIALAAPDTYGMVLATGITCSLIYQAIINIGVVTATLPFTGMPLPFISFGGSSLVVCMAGAGLLLAVSRRTLPDELQDEELRETGHLRRRNRRARVSGARRRRRPSTAEA
ncbi:MAG: putative lipid II flippase FtsW [Chloroflexi bacterium]|nr:MAG: putative lipid II flippase FtsW [Chloroflexota bacterium]